jgi:hypothetical protein
MYKVISNHKCFSYIFDCQVVENKQLDVAPINSNCEEIDTDSEYYNYVASTLKEHNIGIHPMHALKMLSVAQSEDLVIGVRPFPAPAQSLALDGTGVAKGIGIKAKSAGCGPGAGYIPRDQNYSKLCGDPTKKEQIEYYNKGNEELINNGSCISKHLRLKEDRIIELRDQYSVLETSILKKNEIILYVTTPTGTTDEFIAKYCGNSEYAIFHRKDNKPFEIMADADSGKPIIPDYDLFLLSVPIEKAFVNGMDTRTVNMSVFENKNLSHEDKAKYINQKSDKQLGNTTPRVTKILPLLNNALGVNMFMHGDDTGNPGSNLQDNFPAFFALPRLPEIVGISANKLGITTITKEGCEEFAIIKNKEEFDRFVLVMKDASFYMENSPRWGKRSNSTGFCKSHEFFNTLPAETSKLSNVEGIKLTMQRERSHSFNLAKKFFVEKTSPKDASFCNKNLLLRTERHKSASFSGV